MPNAPQRMDSAGERRRYEAEFAKLATSLPTAAASSLMQAFMALEARLDAGLMEAKSTLLVSGLLTTEEDEALGAWIYQQHSTLARAGYAIARKALAEGEDQVQEAMWTVALSLLHWGEAVKWELMVGRREQRGYAMLHDLARMAMKRGRLQDRGKFIVEGLEREASIEALYFHTLLLDRFTNGNLTRQQIEVLDAWLWEWGPSLVSRTEPQGPVLRADLDREHGLRYGPREDGGETLYLALAPLEAQRGAVIAEFHAGRIVPSRGRASEIRIEAHIAVLIQLRQAFSGNESRAARRRIEGGRQAEAWFGLADITSMLLLEEERRNDPRMDASEPAKTRRAGDVYDEVYEKPRRFVTLVDESDTGWLVEASTAAAAPMLIGELVAVRVEENGFPHVARVVRRVRDAGSDRVQVGLQLLSDRANRTRPCSLRPETGAEETYVYVPGSDASGSRDTFIVPFRLLESRVCFRVKRGGQDFALEFNRVRKRGRGWAQAGFEMVDPKLEFLVA